MSSTSPSPSSFADASASATTPTSTPSSSSSSSPPIFVGFIGISVLTFCLVSLLMWRKLSGRDHPLASTPELNTRPLQNANVLAAGRPEMFDAWMGKRASDGLKWEESMPFSVTFLTDAKSDRTSEAVRKGKTGKHRGKSATEKEGEELNPGNPGLQVAVLVAMPSQLHGQYHDGHAASGGSLRDELAIGLIEMSWDRHSPKRHAS